MAMDLLDMELSDAEVHAFISFVDESDDGDVDLTELDAAMKGFLRIKRVNPKFGEKTAPRMTEDEIESATAYIMQELGDEYEARASNECWGGGGERATFLGREEQSGRALFHSGLMCANPAPPARFCAGTSSRPWRISLRRTARARGRWRGSSGGRS
jgi:hypothetical protein